MQSYPRIPSTALCDATAALLTKLGQPLEHARMTARWLVSSDARGIHSHGLRRLSAYVAAFESGRINLAPKVRRTEVRSGAAVLDGDNGLGVIAGMAAMDWGIAAARTNGISLALVRHSNHYGMAGFFVQRAMDECQIAVTGSNAPSSVAPWGARKAVLGTNPIAIGVPGGRHPGLVLDMATSAIPRGRLRFAERADGPVPPGAAVGPDGRPARSARDALAGALLPFGGAKGFGLGLFVDMLSGVLSGGAYGLDPSSLHDAEGAQANLGQFFIVIDPQAFMSKETFLLRCDDLLDMIKSAPPAEGFEAVRIPGERAWRSERESRAKGVPLPPDALRDLAALCRRHDVPADFLETPEGPRAGPRVEATR